MRIRSLIPFALTLTIACGGGADDAATADASQEYEADAAATMDTNAEAIAAVNGLAEYWATHYNMGHGSMVASTLADESLFWTPSGMTFGKEAIEAALNGQIEAASPQLDIGIDETLIFGEVAMTRGTYALNAEAEGQAMSNTGYWISFAQVQEDGEWKTIGIVGNLDSPDQTPMPGESMPLPENGLGAELLQEQVDYYMTHFNMGHGGMVADRYTEDAVVMGAGESINQGREAVAARLTEMTGAGAQIADISIWQAGELDDQHIGAIGTYTLEAGGETQNGHFISLYQRNDEGTPLLHWLLTGASAGM